MSSPQQQEYQRRWFQNLSPEQREIRRERERKWRMENKERENAKRRRAKKERLRRRREQVYAAYGGKCAHCGEDRFDALEVDHIHGVPAQHRSKNGKRFRTSELLGRLIDEGFPPTVQLLCGTCHNIKTRTN